MKLYDIDAADGNIADLRDMTGTTMTHDHGASCSLGHTPLVRSSRRVYCNKCGVWWWWSRAEVKSND